MAGVTREKQWFALYTRARAEKKVFDELQKVGIAAFLPLIKKERKWSDRKKIIDAPLFNSYVFVSVDVHDYYQALNVYGAVRFVTFEGKPVPIPEKQIQAIRRYIDDPLSADDQAAVLETGQMVTIKSGPMEGLIGQLVGFRNKTRLMVHIDAVGQTICVHIERSKVKPIEPLASKNH